MVVIFQTPLSQDSVPLNDRLISAVSVGWLLFLLFESLLALLHLDSSSIRLPFANEGSSSCSSSKEACKEACKVAFRSVSASLADLILNVIFSISVGRYFMI